MHVSKITATQREPVTSRGPGIVTSCRFHRATRFFMLHYEKMSAACPGGTTADTGALFQYSASSTFGSYMEATSHFPSLSATMTTNGYLATGGYIISCDCNGDNAILLGLGEMTARASAIVSVSFVPLPALAITTPSPLPNGTVSVPYNQTLAATGGAPPYAWSIVSGSLPDGLSLDANSGAITRTPTSATTATFTVQVTDRIGTTATQQFTLSVVAPLVITTANPLPDGTVGVSYGVTLEATGAQAITHGTSSRAVCQMG